MGCAVLIFCFGFLLGSEENQKAANPMNHPKNSDMGCAVLRFSFLKVLQKQTIEL